MKTVSIIYNQPLTQVQGINYVNNSFVQGTGLFRDNGLELVALYSPDMEFRCEGKARLDTIGSNLSEGSYLRRRRIRLLLKKLFSSHTLAGAAVKLYFNFYRNAELAVERYFRSGRASDYLIFQDFLSAAYYLRHIASDRRARMILILHSSNNPLEQMIPLFPGWFRYKFLAKKTFDDLKKAMYGVNKVVYLSRHAVGVSPLPDELKTHVYNGIKDIDRLHLKTSEGILNLVCVANVSEHKGQKIVIEAMSLLEEDVLDRIHFYVIGGGYFLPECKRLANETGLQDHITFMGIRNDVPNLLEKMDVFILPSLSEGMPMSMLEAMRQGLYIMATDTGAISEMLDDSFGRIITRNPLEVASALSSMVRDGWVTQEARDASRDRYVRYFSLSRMISSYSDILKSL